MTVIVSEDFENWNVNSWLIYSDGSQIIYDVGRSGSKGLYLQTSKAMNNKEFIYRYPAAIDEVTITAYIRAHLLTLGLFPCDSFIYVEDGGASVAQYMVGFKKIGGVPCFVAYSGATDAYYPLQVITYDQWYKIKLVIKRHATDGFDKLYIDDVLVVDNSGINTELAGGVGMNGFYFGMVGGNVTDWWFDMDDLLIEEGLPTEEGAYSGLVKNQDVILIWIARDEANLGVPAYKAFGGRIVNPQNRAEKYGAFYIDLDCHGHAYEVNIPPSLLQAYYPATNGRTIIEGALALCTYLTKHPVATFWFDNAGSSGSTDDRINSTHDVVYDEEVPMAAIKEILEKAKNPAVEPVQGFDVYETPSGVLVGHLRNSLDFTSPIASITPDSYQKGEDLHRVRNRNKVYGKREKPYPIDEVWTEAITEWIATQGTLSTDADRIIGTCSLKGIADTSANLQFYRTFAQLKANPKTFKANFSRLQFLLKLHALTGGGLHIRLYAPDAGNYFDYPLWRDHDYSADADVLTWLPVELKLGPDYETVFEAKGLWTKGGSPDWSNIQGINFFFILGITNYALFDDLKFMDTFYSATASDTPSIEKYGVRCGEPERDDGLKSDAECLARAESIKATLKDPVITLSDVVVDGDHRYNPGDRQRTIVANDILDAYFRIIQLQHKVKGAAWDTVLTLSNEPQYVDYVFKLLKETQTLLNRRS